MLCYLVKKGAWHGESNQNESTSSCCGPMLSSSSSLPSPHFIPIAELCLEQGKREKMCVGGKKKNVLYDFVKQSYQHSHLLPYNSLLQTLTLFEGIFPKFFQFQLKSSNLFKNLTKKSKKSGKSLITNTITYHLSLENCTYSQIQD